MAVARSLAVITVALAVSGLELLWSDLRNDGEAALSRINLPFSTSSSLSTAVIARPHRVLGSFVSVLSV